MAWLIGDSFDFYAATADAAPYYWDTTGSWSLSTTTRFGVGQSFKCSSGSSAMLTKAFSNEQTWFICCAHYNSSALSGATHNITFGLLDGASVQCTISLRSDGSILFYGGTTAP